MKRKSLFTRQLILLFSLGVLFFNYPILSIFSRDATIGGIPVLYAFIFIAWLMLIGGIATVLERRNL